MTAVRIARRSLLALIACAVASDAVAAVTGFTSRAAFDAATAEFTPVTALDFEEFSAGTLFQNGGSSGVISFGYSIGDNELLVVIDAFETTSGLNSLGVTGDLAFLAGDSFGMSVPEATAIGLFVIGEDMLPGDVVLSIGAGSVANGAPDGFLAGGSSVYFLGLVESDPALAFTFATLESFLVEDVGDFVWNVDDIHLAPEPDTVLGNAVAWLVLAVLATRVRT